LSAKQDDFLKALVAKGVPAAVVTRNVRNYDGNVAAAVPLRYTLVFDGMALKYRICIGAIRSMPQVKSVHADEKLTTNLNNSVPYIRAPQVYGKSAELSQFDTLNEGYEGQGMYVSIIDTGIDWTHPMFGGIQLRRDSQCCRPVQLRPKQIRRLCTTCRSPTSASKMVSVTARTSLRRSPAFSRRR
jgi:hypothetical protein